MRKRILIWLLTFALVSAVLPQALPLARAETVSGSCGDNLSWEFDSETGVLTIVGSGEMQNWYAENLVPWAAYRGAITSIIFPQELTSIGEYAFKSCIRLKSVVIPAGVVSIGNYAFSNCSKLESVDMPSSVKQVGDHVFWCCSSLTSVIVPDSLLNISSYMFASCTRLNSVTIPESVTKIDRNAFASCSNLATIKIPDSVISIGDYAFINCTSLSNVDIGTSVTGIGYEAFYNCVSLPEITIPNSVTTIGGSAFSTCKSLTSAKLPESISVIPNNVFRGCSNLTEINIPNSVTCIGWGAFSHCTGLTHVLIPSSVQSIEYYAFADCTSLAEVTISYAVKRIDYRAFYNCTSLLCITIPSSVTSIGENAFGFFGEYRPYDEDHRITDFTIYGYPDTAAMGYAEKYRFPFVAVEEIRTGTCGDALLWSFNTGSSVLKITGCGEMTDWIWSEDVPWHNFREQILTIELPDELESIGSHAFYGCSALTSLTIPGSVTSIGWNPFYDCDSLTAFEVAESNPAYSNDAAGVLFDKSKTTVVYCPCAFAGQYEIPNSVTAIGAYAFSPCPRLTDVIIPDSVQQIGDYAFYRCPSMTSVTIPKSVTIIEIGAFGVLWDAEHFSEHLAEGFIIYGYAFSTAQIYAENAGITFVALDEDTCISGHTPGAAVRLNEVATTCTNPGSYDEVIYCTVCGQEISRVTNEIAALGHDWDNGIVTVEPTESTDGIRTFTCTRCGETKTDSIPKLDPTSGGNPFTDVAEGTYYTDAVLWAVQNGITSGTSATTFSPNAGCTRAQVVTFLWRAAGSPEPTSTNNPFTDVTGGYYYKAVLWAVENNITSGTSATTFSPNSTCTRAQIVTFLWRFEGSPAPKTMNNPFTDVKAGAYYEKAVLWASETGVTAGTSATTFSPDATCTRAQVVTFLYRDIVD